MGTSVVVSCIHSFKKNKNRNTKQPPIFWNLDSSVNRTQNKLFQFQKYEKIEKI